MRVLGVQRAIADRTDRIGTEPRAAIGRGGHGSLNSFPHVPSVTPLNPATADHNS